MFAMNGFGKKGRQRRDTGKLNSRHDSKSSSRRSPGSKDLSGNRYNPLLITAAVLGVAVIAGGAYRYMRPARGRAKYKSRSHEPQISRWESEGGSVPQVQPVRPRTQH